MVSSGEREDGVIYSSRIQEQLACGKREELHDEHGITSFLFEDKRPFNHAKFTEFLENDYPEEIIRAKGYLWFADDDMHVQPFEQAGRNASVTEVSNWLAAFPEDEQKRTKRKYPELRKLGTSSTATGSTRSSLSEKTLNRSR